MSGYWSEQLAESIDKYKSLQIAFEDTAASLKQQTLINETQAASSSVPPQRARVTVRRSGSVVIHDNAQASSWQTAKDTINKAALSILTEKGKCHVIRRTDAGDTNGHSSPGLGSLKVQVQRMKEQAAQAAQRAREDVNAVEVAAAGMKEKLRLMEEERESFTQENRALVTKVNSLENDLSKAKTKFDALEEKYNVVNKELKEAKEKVKSLEKDIDK